MNSTKSASKINCILSQILFCVPLSILKSSFTIVPLKVKDHPTSTYMEFLYKCLLFCCTLFTLHLTFQQSLIITVITQQQVFFSVKDCLVSILCFNNHSQACLVSIVQSPSYVSTTPLTNFITLSQV